MAVRSSLLLVFVMGVLFVAPAAAGADLASDLLAANNAGDRAALLRQNDRARLASALDAIEQTAGVRYDAKQYQTALDAYEVALEIAQAANLPEKVPFCFRRIGMCNAYMGKSEAALAAYRAGISAAEAVSDTPMLIENLHGTANILQRLGRFEEALPVSQRETALAEKAGRISTLVHALAGQAQILGELGRLREALRIGQRAYDLSPDSDMPADIPLALGNLAVDFAELGDMDTALRLLRQLPAPTANDLNSIGIVEEHLHHDDEAEAAYQAAIAKSAAPVLWRIRAATFVNLGILQHRRGRLGEARVNVEQALSISRAQHDVGGTSNALAQLAEIAADAGDAATALARAAESVDLARQSESPELMINALSAQAHVFEAAGRTGDAEKACAGAIDIAENWRADTPASVTGLDDELIQWMPAYQYGAALAIRRGNAMAALQLADKAKARVLLDMLDGGQPRFDALAGPEEQAEKRQARDAVSKARQAAIARPDAATQAALEQALRKEDDVDLRIFARHPELALQRAAPRQIAAEDLAALIPDSRTAILSYFVLDDSVALFVIRRDTKTAAPEVRVFELAGIRRLDPVLQSFRAQIASRDLDYRSSARALYGSLLAPAAAFLQGTTRWVISPDGPLWDIPFQALMDPRGQHILETRTVSYAPSLSVLRQLRRTTPAGPAPLSLLVVANPSAKGAAPIPGADREAATLASLYGPSRSALLTGDRANETLFRRNAGNADVIQITSHAETEANHPLDSFLLLSPDKPSQPRPDDPDDGALSARDLLAMRLRATLVVLSACETARGKIGQGEGVIGLGWAALAAGARASVLSQWKVDSAATSDLMIDFHRRLTGSAPGAGSPSGINPRSLRPVDKAEALRLASLDIMRSPGRRHPFYWAPFILLGDPSGLK